MKHKVRLNPSNVLNVDWDKTFIIILGGTAISLMTILNYQIVSIYVAGASIIISSISPIKNLMKLINNRSIIIKIWNIVNSEQLVDYYTSDYREFIYNSATVDVFENQILYRLDFRPNGISHSDNIYHLDDRITESFQSILVDKKRHSWGMSYFVRK